MASRRDHDFGFFAWMLPGFLIGFGLVAILSIGVLFVAAGLLAFVYLWVRGPGWPADLGLLAGLGVASLTFAGIALASGDYPASPWLPIGAALVGSSALTFWWLRCRPERSPG